MSKIHVVPWSWRALLHLFSEDLFGRRQMFAGHAESVRLGLKDSCSMLVPRYSFQKHLIWGNFWQTSSKISSILWLETQKIKKTPQVFFQLCFQFAFLLVCASSQKLFASLFVLYVFCWKQNCTAEFKWRYLNRVTRKHLCWWCRSSSTAADTACIVTIWVHVAIYFYKKDDRQIVFNKLCSFANANE